MAIFAKKNDWPVKKSSPSPLLGHRLPVTALALSARRQDKLIWPKRVTAVYWLLGTLLYPWHHKELDQLKKTSVLTDMKLLPRQVYPKLVHKNTVQQIITVIVHKTVFGAYYHNHLTAWPVLWSLGMAAMRRQDLKTIFQHANGEWRSSPQCLIKGRKKQVEKNNYVIMW